jgi:Homeodomain-like domain
MNIAGQLYENQKIEAEKAIAEYRKKHKEQLLKYPTMVPVYDEKTKKVYCIFKPRNVDDLLDIMIGMSKKDVDRILKQYGYFEQRNYVYKELDLTETERKKKSTNPPESSDTTSKLTESQKKNISQMAKFFSFAFDTTADVYVHLFNKETSENYFYPITSLKDPIKLSSILHSYKFGRNIDLMYSLSTFKTMKNATDENVYSIPLIQVDVDFRKITKYKKKTPQQVWKLILDYEIGKSIPYPSAIEYGHQLRLLYKLQDLYVKKGSDASKNIARRISKVFAKRLSKYGAEAQPITSHGRIVGSINSKDGSTVKIELFGYEYCIEEIKEKWLDPLPDWYLEWKKSTKKKENTKVQHKTSLTLNKKRIEDLFRIVDYFNGDLDGRRFLCFLVRSLALSAGYTPKEARNLMLELNNRFKHPLRQNIIERDTRNVERKQYYYKNETILGWLGITPEMEEKMQLETIISKTEKRRRNRVTNARRYRAKKYGDPNISKRSLIEKEKQRIKTLLDQGKKKKDICETLEIHPKTLQRRIKELKSEGLL